MLSRGISGVRERTIIIISRESESRFSISGFHISRITTCIRHVRRKRTLEN